MWTREEAIWVVERLEPLLAEVGAHCALSGSVMYRGTSDKDLDLIIYPHANKPLDVQENSPVSNVLQKFFKCDKLNDATAGNGYDKGDDTSRLILYCWTPKGKRVDFFFLD